GQVWCGRFLPSAGAGGPGRGTGSAAALRGVGPKRGWLRSSSRPPYGHRSFREGKWFAGSLAPRSCQPVGRPPDELRSLTLSLAVIVFARIGASIHPG